MVSNMSNYRNDAKSALARAKAELATNDVQRLKYAALELRMVMENITYDRALAYKDEFPEAEYNTWQPRKVMAELLEIDPDADKESSLAIGIESVVGTPSQHMQNLGAEKTLSMKKIKTDYDAIGSYLHIQTIGQLKSGQKIDFTKFRNRCDDIKKYCEEILSSPVFNITMGIFATLNCEECCTPVRKRMPHGANSVEAVCRKCGAFYDVTDIGNGETEWKQQQRQLECVGPECGRPFWVGKHLIKSEFSWKCDGCHGRNTLGFGISFEKDDIPTSPS
jgi:hypothetical protein